MGEGKRSEGGEERERGRGEIRRGGKGGNEGVEAGKGR